MTQPPTIDSLMPHTAPDARAPRTLLFVIRRLAAHDLDDAHAANAMLAAFGMHYRRPLMFMRVLLTELARVSQQPIVIAPCCCPRMTEGEAAILLAIDIARAHPDVVRSALARIAGSLDVLPVLSVAQALGDALDDIGRPFRP
ncbi:MAG: DUF6628 family protein [Sphingomonadaceae bacterium]